jgi:serine phosphatase RsbU (regulator of sigma subunit)
MNHLPFDPEQEDATRTVLIPGARKPFASPSRTGWAHHLVQQSGNDDGRRAPLTALPLRMGRRAQCEWVVADPEVSSLHCQVLVDPHTEEAVVTDLGSTNGTFVDGVRVAGRAVLANGALLQMGSHVFRHDYRPAREAQRAEELARDLETASRYIRSLLPPPMRLGPVRTEWYFQPSALLGGDALGYFQLDASRFAGYLIDVSGHGIGAAVHTVSVLNVLRQRALPGVDFARPEQVLQRLNAMFSMEEHGGLYFTMWYGVYDMQTRNLVYVSAGHHAAYLVSADRLSFQPLKTRNPVVGAMPDHCFQSAQVRVPEGSMLHIFSDGLFEVESVDGHLGRLSELEPLMLGAPMAGLTEPERLVMGARERARPGPPDDDVSLLTVTFLT